MKTQILLIALLLGSLPPLISQAQMGYPFSFPEGESSRQLPLPDTLTVTCDSRRDGEILEDSSWYISTLFQFIDTVQFPSGTPSYFTTENIQDHYFFLATAYVDRFGCQDVDYSLLRFLRLKSQEQHLASHLTDSVEDHVGPAPRRTLHFEMPIQVRLIEFNRSWKAKLSTYTEFWKCSNKFDYSPMLPGANALSSKGLKVKPMYDPEEQPFQFLSNPDYVLGILSLDQTDKALGTLRGTSKPATMRSLTGRLIEGRSLDLNRDHLPDAFWFTQPIPSTSYEYYTVLYLNVEGKWVPMWFTYVMGSV
jgi:hypothetical protein